MWANPKPGAHECTYLLTGLCFANGEKPIFDIEGDVIKYDENSVGSFLVETSLLTPENGIIGSRLVPLDTKNLVVESSRLVLADGGRQIPAIELDSKWKVSYVVQCVDIIVGEETAIRDYRYFSVNSSKLDEISRGDWSDIAMGEGVEVMNRFGMIEYELHAGPQAPVKALSQEKLDSRLENRYLEIESGDNISGKGVSE